MPEPTVPTPSTLVEAELIKRLKYRYLRCLDQKEWEGVESCFTVDATASYGGGAHRFESRAEIMVFLRSSLGSEEILTSHRCHHPEIDLEGVGVAVGIWALEDVVILTEADLTISGAAFYEDRYRKVDGTWLIEHTGYRRTYEEMFPRSSVQGLKLTAHWWETGGRSQLQG